MKKIITIILLIFLTKIFAQNTDAPFSEKIHAVVSKGDAHEINQLSRQLIEKNSEESYKLALKALEIATKTRNIREEAAAYHNIGAYYYQKSDIPKAKEYFNRALKKFLEARYPFGIAISKNALGVIAEMQADYSTALKNYKEAHRIFMIINDAQGIMGTLNNISKIFHNLGMHQQTIKYLKYNLYMARKIGDNEAIATCLSNLNAVNAEIADTTNLKSNYEKLYETYKKENNKVGLTLILHNLGSYKITQNQLEEAKKLFEEELDYALETGNLNSIATAYADLAYYELLKKNYNKAEELMQKSQEIALELNVRRKVASNYLLMAEIAEAKGDYKKAYYYLKRNKNISDSLNTSELNVQLAEFQSEFESLKQDKEISILRKEKEIQALTINKQFTALMLIIILTASLFVIGFLFYRRNLAKIKTAQIISLKNKELTEANETKDRMFSILAHDLKNPIAAFYGLTTFMSNEYSSISDAEKQKMLEQLAKSSKNVMDILENVVNWAKTKAEGFVFKSEEINVREAVNDIFNIASLDADKKNIELLNHVSNNIVFYSDKNMLLAVLRNLISNAVKFTNTGGKIVVNSRYIEDFVQIEIIDNGVGMDKEQLENLFKPGKHTSTLGTNKETGSGLGLLLCKEFIEKANGKISISSNKNEGTTVTLTFPLLLRIKNESQD